MEALDRDELRRVRLTPAGAEEVEALVFERLRDYARTPRTIRRGTTWFLLDIDSLDLIALCHDVEDRFGARITNDVWRSIRTVGDLIDAVQRQRG